MAEQNFSVAPDRVTALTGSLVAGATIINTSSVHAVWVSANPNVAPGLGVRLGPKGSTSWTTDGAPVYACPDTGVTIALTVTVSSDMAPPVNPVDVGVAVAAQLLAQGVPSVLTGRVLGPSDIVGNTIDVSGFASITTELNVTTACKVSTMFTSDAAGNEIIGGRDFTMSKTGKLKFTSEVSGPYFTYVSSPAGAVSTYQGYGSNRSLGDKVQNVNGAVGVTFASAWTAGSSQELPLTLVTNGGLHRIRLAVTGSGTGFLQTTVWNDTTAALTFFPLADTNEAHASPSTTPGIVELNQTIILPPGKLAFNFLPYTTGSYSVVLNIIPVS